MLNSDIAKLILIVKTKNQNLFRFQNRDVADNLCVSANAHLWIVDSQSEFDLVTKHFQLQKVEPCY